MREQKTLYIPIWFYSNVLELNKKAAVANFTFQSGFILIGKEFDAYCIQNQLYIPIWFYSNPSKGRGNYTEFTFTFQFGFILMHPHQQLHL